MIIISFFLGMILMIGAYRWISRTSNQKDAKTKSTQEHLQETRDRARQNIWNHSVSYRGKHISLPCKYSEIEKALPTRSLNRVRGLLTLTDGSEIYLNTGYMGEMHEIPQNGSDFDVYGLLVHGKKLSVGGIKAGMSQKKVLKLLGKPTEASGDEWMYKDPDDVANHRSEGRYFIIMFRDKKVYTMEIYNDGATVEEIQ